MFKQWIILSIASKGPYNYARVPNHPNCNRCGYVLEHRIVMENKLGRLLRKDEAVHHINHNRKDNRPENLEVINWLEHSKIHNITKPKIKFICDYCGGVGEKKSNDFKYHMKHNKTGLFCKRKCVWASMKK